MKSSDSPTPINTPSSKTPQPARRRWTIPASLSLVVLGAGIAVAGNRVVSSSPIDGLSMLAQSPAPQEQQAEPDTYQAALPPIPSRNFISDVVQSAGPAVVRIDASRTVARSTPEAFNDPMFRQFFGGRPERPFE